MRAKACLHIQDQQRNAAFSLTELLVAVALAALFFAAVYTAVACSVDLMRVTRENLRATQILEQKIETLRLYSWAQITNSNTLVTNFVDSFFPLTNSSGNYVQSGYGTGLTYTGALAVTAAPINQSYSNDLRLATVTLQWKSGDLLRKRDMKTLVSKHGIQHYVY